MLVAITELPALTTNQPVFASRTQVMRYAGMDVIVKSDSGDRSHRFERKRSVFARGSATGSFEQRCLGIECLLSRLGFHDLRPQRCPWCTGLAAQIQGELGLAKSRCQFSQGVDWCS